MWAIVVGEPSCALALQHVTLWLLRHRTLPETVLQLQAPPLPSPCTSAPLTLQPRPPAAPFFQESSLETTSSYHSSLFPCIQARAARLSTTTEGAAAAEVAAIQGGRGASEGGAGVVEALRAVVAAVRGAALGGAVEGARELASCRARTFQLAA